MAIIDGGSSTAGKANVDSAYNLQVVTPMTTAAGVAQGGGTDAAGFVALLAESDPGLVTGSRTAREIEASPDFRLRMGMDTVLFDLDFAGTTIAQAHVQQNLSTFTAAQTAGFLTLNSGASTAAANANIRSYPYFPLYGSYPTYFEFWAKVTNEAATNSVTELGVGLVSGATALATDGVFFRWNAGGGFRAVMNYNGAETATASIASAPATNTAHHFVIVVHNEQVEFWINDVLQAILAVPSGQPSPTLASQLPWFARVYNTTTASAARTIGVGRVNVSLGDHAPSIPFGHIAAGLGGGGYQFQPGSTSGGTVSRAAAARGWPASATALVAGTWTATSAPAANDLGGRWLSPAISTLTSEADYPVFAFQNPAGTASLPGKTLFVTGIRVGETIATAAASTNGIMLCFAVGVGSTTAATNTSDAAAAVGARIIPLGQCYFKSTAAVGDAASGFNLDFSQAPLVVPPGTFLHFIVRPVGTVASNTLVVAGMVNIAGYFR